MTEELFLVVVLMMMVIPLFVFYISMNRMSAVYPFRPLTPPLTVPTAQPQRPVRGVCYRIVLISVVFYHFV